MTRPRQIGGGDVRRPTDCITKIACGSKAAAIPVPPRCRVEPPPPRRPQRVSDARSI